VPAAARICISDDGLQLPLGSSPCTGYPTDWPQDISSGAKEAWTQARTGT